MWVIVPIENTAAALKDLMALKEIMVVFMWLLTPVECVRKCKQE
jgi:hypothetical protein